MCIMNDLRACMTMRARTRKQPEGKRLMYKVFKTAHTAFGSAAMLVGPAYSCPSVRGPGVVRCGTTLKMYADGAITAEGLYCYLTKKAAESCCYTSWQVVVPIKVLWCNIIAVEDSHGRTTTAVLREYRISERAWRKAVA